MKIRRVRNQTPQSSPPRVADGGGTAGDERFVWEMLVPRLVHPGKLAIVQALLAAGGPLPLVDLAKAVDLTVEHTRYHCKAMQTAGVLEVVGAVPGDDGESEEPSYFFSMPGQAPPTEAAAK